MKKYDYFCRILNKICVGIGVALLAIVAIITFVQVVQRNTILKSWGWAEELSRYLVIFAVYFASGYVFYVDANAKVDLIFNKFSHKVQKALNCMFLTLIAIFLVFMFKYGLIFVKRNLKVWCASMRIPWAVPFASLLLGSVNMFLQIPAKFYHILMDDNQKGEA